ncbi:uncharacterized protein LY89DRAFT_754243 [Mollisia scopiformis]|uniref:Uncharacterized protein n=1 Tax=Mollisia scopiformis TaxID=149040 RepID=A0A194X0T8_MOLSC|nr:uncharacterized protein LY89DRAFT_754243 [Mollisia scopiformis]KUJ13477.1 hypothetical protein LY89DRAFT_754243 [Mollisia scopiformis]
MRLHSSFVGAIIAIFFTTCSCDHQRSKKQDSTGDSTIKPINSSQPVNGSGKFTGSASCLEPLARKTKYFPDIAQEHQDGGNTGSVDFPGPQGRNISMTTFAFPIAPLLFDHKGRITTGVITDSGDAIAAIDSETLQVISEWNHPAGIDLKVPYMQESLDGDINNIVVGSQQGRLFVVQKNNSVHLPTFTTMRDINLTQYLQLGEVLLNFGYDGLLNIWFTTGLISGTPGTSTAPQNTTTIGYLTPSDEVYTIHIPHSAVENGIAIQNTSVYVITGLPMSDMNSATAYILALAPGEKGIETLWSAPYNAGLSLKPGGFARGSGTTPTLLGDAYVAFADNNDTQIHVNIYHQAKQASNQSQLLCQVPVFHPGQSACDNAPNVHAGEDGYTMVLFNDYNTPGVYPSPTTSQPLNGPFNNLTQMTPGGVQIHIPLYGSDCRIAWEKPIRMSALPILSTETGLLYGYEQNLHDSLEGEWVWYVTARDWRTGNLVWKVETGGGGSFDDDYQSTVLGRDGTLYQGVVDGIVMLKDGEGEGCDC